MRAVLYARVSTLEEEQLSALEHQINDLKATIRNNGWELVDEYIDRGKSGTKTKRRDSYNQMFDDIETDKFDVIVVTHQDRLQRNTKDWYLFIDKIVQNKKKLYFSLDRKFYEADDALITGIKAILASEFSRELSKKIRNSQKRRQDNGTPIITNRTWGYDNIDGNIVVNESEAEIIRLVFNLYEGGKGFRLIEQELFSRGILSRSGKPFSLTTLKRMVRNPIYTGTMVMNKQTKDFDTGKMIQNSQDDWIIKEGVLPQIIDKEQFDRCQIIVESKTQSYSKKGKVDKDVLAGRFKGTHTYSALIRCEKCGSNYHHTNNTQGYDAYQCARYRQYGKNNELGCDNTILITKHIDSIVRNTLIDLWDNKDDYIKSLYDVLETIIGESENDIDLKAVQNEIDKLTSKKDRLIDMMADELISKQEYKVKKEKLDDEIDKLSSIIKDYNNRDLRIEEKQNRLDEIVSALEKISNFESLDNDIVSAFISQILVNGNDITIILNNGDTKYHNVAESRQV